MKVAFVDHPLHHKTTGSSLFFLELLERWFSNVRVVELGNLWRDLPGTFWDLIIVWQHWYPRVVLDSLPSKNVVFVPMWDDCPSEKGPWEPLKGIKILSFSQTLSKRLVDWGHRVLPVEYWPPTPATSVQWDSGLKGFFWPRNQDLDWRHVGPLAEGVSWVGFQIHTGNSDPRVQVPSEKFLDNAWVRSHWFAAQKDYQECLERANVFFAPRRREGIGMALLEALARGMAVVAPNLPTANEYIESGESGWLYDPDRPLPLPDLAWQRLGENARRRAQDGRIRWEQSLPNVQAFLADSTNLPPRRVSWWVIVRGHGKVLYLRLKALVKRLIP